MNICEGEIGRVKAGDDLNYPGINSCLAITVVLESNDRCGGHAVLVPEGKQKNLTQILDGIAGLAAGEKIKQILVIGDIKAWTDNWNDLRVGHGIPKECHGLKDYICSGFTHVPVTLKDVVECWQGGTFDVKFLKGGIIEVEKHDPNKRYVIGNYHV